MIIKITVDDGIAENDASEQAAALIATNSLFKSRKDRLDDGLFSEITHISKAGNIFIHVSKVE